VVVVGGTVVVVVAGTVVVVVAGTVVVVVVAETMVVVVVVATVVHWAYRVVEPARVYGDVSAVPPDDAANQPLNV